MNGITPRQLATAFELQADVHGGTFKLSISSIQDISVHSSLCNWPPHLQKSSATRMLL